MPSGGRREGAGRKPKLIPAAVGAPEVKSLADVPAYLAWAICQLDSGAASASVTAARSKLIGEFVKASNADHTQNRLKNAERILAEIQKREQRIAALVAEARMRGVKVDQQ